METPLLLTDKQVQEFLINGYLVLQPVSLDEDFHSTIFRQAQWIFEKEGNPGNNILPQIPQLQYVFDDSVIRGALESLLGSNYTMQPHRHAHLTSPGTQDQLWHKDSYFGYQKPLRHHQLRYIMAMYYPQDITSEMGPTAIKPRSQYDVMDPKIRAYNKTRENPNKKNDDQHDIYMICRAGTVVLIHYDIVHKGTANRTSNSNRFMFKFQFNRLEEPTKPTWNHDPTNAYYDATDAGLLQPIVTHVWNWMIGRMITLQQPPIDQDIITWKTQLDNQDGKIRLNAAYNLALNNQYNILIQRLYHRKEICRIEATYALTACRYNNDALSELQAVLKKEKENEYIEYCIAFIFSEMGSAALDTLPLLLYMVETSDSWLVKQYCCEALGTLQPHEQHAIDMIVRCLTNILADRDHANDPKGVSHMRFTAALSLAKLGAKAVRAIPILKDALYLDPNRYVNGNALLALERIGTNEALKIVLHYLKLSRWSAKTTANKNGAVCIRQLLNKDEIELLQQGIDENLAHPSSRFKVASRPDDTGRSVEDFCTWETNPYYKQFIYQSPCAPVAGLLMKSSTSRLYHDHLLVKEPSTKQITPWHQDQPYYNIDGMQTCSFWIPIDPVPRYSTLEFISGSHRDGHWLMPRTFMNSEAKWFPEGTIEDIPNIDANRDAFPIIGWAIEPGDVIAFHMLTLHGARGTTANEGRRRVLLILNTKVSRSSIANKNKLNEKKNLIMKKKLT